MTVCLRLNRLAVILSALALALVLLMPAMTRAELASYFANAMPGWQEDYGEMFKSGKLYGYVEYAVYAPEKLPGALDNDTIDSGQYVYAYQLFNTSGTSTDKVTHFSIGLEEHTTASNITEIDDPGPPIGNAASYVGFASAVPPYGSARWQYTTTATYIWPSQKSKILLFNSPYAPDDINATVKFNNLNAVTVYNLPTPLNTSHVPEPATLLSLIIAGGMFFLVRILRGNVFK